jgi:Na+-driven multidrug efflux pump
MSRYVELAIVLWWTHSHRERNRFAVGLYKGFSVPGELAARIVKKGWPLLLNEFLFSMGITIINQCYSTRGLAAVAAVNISAVLTQLFRVVVFAGGSAISILVGNRLGAGRMEEARDVDNKLFFTTVTASAAVGVILFLVAPLFPRMYNTTDEVRALATGFLRIAACFFPVMAFNNNCYFTLRAGGKTFITFLFDSMFIWAIILPPAFAVSRLTNMGVIAMYLMVQSLELVKSVGGFLLVRSGMWISNIVSKE